MKFDFCYQKAFWVVIPILITVSASVMGVAWGMILENQDRSIENELELAERYDAVINNIPDIEDKVDTNYSNILRLCIAFDVECKE